MILPCHPAAQEVDLAAKVPTMWGRAGLILGFQDVLQVGEVAFPTSLAHAEHNRIGYTKQALEDPACLRFADEADPCAVLTRRGCCRLLVF